MIARISKFVNGLFQPHIKLQKALYYAFFIEIILGLAFLMIYQNKIELKQKDLLNKQIYHSNVINNLYSKPELNKKVDSKNTLSNYASSSKELTISLAPNAASSSILGYYQAVPILMYHYIENAPARTKMAGLYLDPKIFESQISEINKEKINSVFVSEFAKTLILKKTLSSRSVILTFDDGYEDFYSIVYPLLKKYKVKATVYVIINALDKPGYLTKEQVRELANSEYVEIGSHTFNHLNLKNLNEKKAIFEIVNSKRALENISGKAILSFCYPFGLYQDFDIKLASSAGYLASVSTHSGFLHSQREIQTLTRLRPGERSGTEFKKWLLIFYRK